MAQSKKRTSSKKRSGSAKNRTAAKKGRDRRKADQSVIDEIWGVIFIAVGIFLFAAVQFHAAGELGNTIGDMLRGIFGLMGLVVPWYLIGFGILLFAGKTVHLTGGFCTLVFLILLMLCLINSGRFIENDHLVYEVGKFYRQGVELNDGGVFGMVLGTLLIRIIGRVGLYVFSVVVIIVCLLLVINTPVSRGWEKLRSRREARRADREEPEEEEILEEPKKEKKRRSQERKEISIITPFEETESQGWKTAGSEREKRQKKSNVIKYMQDDSLFSDAGSAGSGEKESLGLDGKTDYGGGYGLDGGPKEKPASREGLGLDGVIQTQPPTRLSKKEAESITLDPAEIALEKGPSHYQKPPVDLLNKPQAKNRGNVSVGLKMKAAKLEETLKNFHVDARVVQVTQGPAVTRYEIQPSVGVKVNSIVRLADDIALNLEAKSIRIEAPIPGKAAVGIEVENDKINMVTLREIIDSKEFKEAKSKITFAVGKDIAGKAIVADLKGMPHLLIAGSTGSGKSVCINSIIASILYKADPDEVKLVLIDPKVVELGNYNGIPHLLIPVVTEPAKAAAALNWAVAEMTDRYKKFAENQVRDLESYNDAMRICGQADQVMPQIVIIIDELADLMMAAPSQVEESICRLAQMARAAGMHLIVATQRPSVDIITGVIKANIPSRIAFAVSSQFDSRTILDMSGAEKLVGKGDMLFNPLGMGKPVRVQGTFISDGEVHKIIEFVKSQVAEVEYADAVMDTIEKGNLTGSHDDDGDELLPEAIQCVVSAGQASVSMLQRRFRIGYNRAARIVDMMEARGIVGPQDGSRPRQVLITEEELEGMKGEVEE
ncbi:MAG: DNA translocase FtsK 4TM domain-containing protein [Anaerovoracaceae bacterium]